MVGGSIPYRTRDLCRSRPGICVASRGILIGSRRRGRCPPEEFVIGPVRGSRQVRGGAGDLDAGRTEASDHELPGTGQTRTVTLHGPRGHPHPCRDIHGTIRSPPLPPHGLIPVQPRAQDLRGHLPRRQRVHQRRRNLVPPMLAITLHQQDVPRGTRRPRLPSLDHTQVDQLPHRRGQLLGTPPSTPQPTHQHRLRHPHHPTTSPISQDRVHGHRKRTERGVTHQTRHPRHAGNTNALGRLTSRNRRSLKGGTRPIGVSSNAQLGYHGERNSFRSLVERVGETHPAPW